MKILKKRRQFVIGISIALWLNFFLVLPGALAKSELLSEVIAKTQERYEKTEDLKAQFIYEVTIKSVDKIERETGMFYLKKPMNMLWDYEKPKTKKIVINQQKAFLYIPGDHVLYVQNVESIFKSMPAVRFFSGIGKLQDEFQISFTQPDHFDGDGNYLLTMVPKDATFSIQKIFLTIDKSNFHIVQCSFTDMYGNVTSIRFRNIMVNNKLSAGLFTFTPPPGVEIVNMP
ncbi:MAG: outer membrane lipoprotein carrier protein LolA [Syntrophales bacterium]